MNLGKFYKNELGVKETAIIFAFMKFAELIIWGFVIYLAYKFIFGLLLPVSKAASQIKENVRKMQEAQQQQNQPPKEDTRAKTEPPTAKGGEYIDYEEVK